MNFNIILKRCTLAPNNSKLYIMKIALCSAAALLLSISAVSAQENVDVKKETVTKRVTVKGTTVETTVTNDVKEERSVIKVEETDEINQVPTVISDTNETTEVVVDTVTTNEANKIMVEEYQKKEAAEIQKSIEEQRAEKKRIDSDVEAIKKANLADDTPEGKKIKKAAKKIDN